MKQIDFHSHYLPRCDHGSDGSETSLKQLSLASEAGVDIMCATPHFYPERENIDLFLSRREQCFKALNGKVTRSTPKMLLGAEVLCFAGIENLPDLSKLCLGDTDILLLEMPFKKWSREIIDSVEKLSRRKDLKIVLAHVDRYPPDEVEELLSFGLYAQLNVDSCCGFFFNKRFAEWISDGFVLAFGSDIHKTDVGYKLWNKCRKRRGEIWDTVMERANELIGCRE